MLDAVRDQLLAWLEAQPALPAADALMRLQEQFPERFGPTQLRTLQRFMKAQRGAAAQKLQGVVGEAPAPARNGVSDTEWRGKFQLEATRGGHFRCRLTNTRMPSGCSITKWLLPPCCK